MGHPGPRPASPGRDARIPCPSPSDVPDRPAPGLAETPACGVPLGDGPPRACRASPCAPLPNENTPRPTLGDPPTWPPPRPEAEETRPTVGWRDGSSGERRTSEPPAEETRPPDG